MSSKAQHIRQKRRPDPLWGLLLLDIILALVIMGINGYNWETTPSKVVGQGVKALIQGRLGPGVPSGRGNHLPLDDLEPGDILLGGNNGSTYGQFTHAAIYEGGGMAWQGWLSTGVSQVRVERFRGYDRSCILRIKTTPQNRQQAVEEIANWGGQVFYPLVFKPGERVWNCTKIIWEAYHRLGFDLDAGQDLWVIPDNLYQSPLVTIIAQDGDLTSGGLSPCLTRRVGDIW